MKDIIVFRDEHGEILVSTDGGETLFPPELFAYGLDSPEQVDPDRHRMVWASGPGA